MSDAKTLAARRTGTVARLVLSVAVMLVFGTMLAPSVDASKKGKNTIPSINDRVAIQKDNCEFLGGGTLEVRALPSGTKVTYCEGGSEDGQRCVHTNRGSTCKQTLTHPPDSTGPVIPPIDDVYEAPTGGRTQAGRDTAAPRVRTVDTP